MSIIRKIDKLLFPKDYTRINHQAQFYFTPLQYTIYRIALFLITLAIFTYVSCFFHPKFLVNNTEIYCSLQHGD